MGISYKKLYERESRKWDALKSHLEKMEQIGEGSKGINYDMNTVRMVLLQMYNQETSEGKE